MSYGASSALQAAVFQTLRDDVGVSGLVGNAVFDAEPAGSLPATYISLGAEAVRDRSDGSGAGAIHDLTVSVVTDQAGFQGAKDVATAVSDALVDADLILTRGLLVSLRFLRARAERIETGATRRIDLVFRALVDNA